MTLRTVVQQPSGYRVRFGFTPLGSVPTIVGDGRQFRFLQDAYINNQYLTAGSIASDLDLLPPLWSPSPDVDPLNTAAVNAFFAAGVQLPGLIRTQFALVLVSPPIVYWKHISSIGGIHTWQLTGNGAGLGTKVGPPPGSNN